MPNAALLDMQRIVRLAAEPCAPGDSVKALIGRSARRLRIGYRRCYSFWYAREETAVRAFEADRLRAEEDRMLIARRVRIEQELAWIEAHQKARSGGPNGLVDTQVVAGLLPVALGSMDGEAQGELVLDAGAQVDGARQADGVIPDPRQKVMPI